MIQSLLTSAVTRASRLLLGLATLALAPSAGSAAVPSNYFGIHVVDEQTGRGVPLVELETVNHLRFVTDSAGWVAFLEPGLMGQPVHFLVRSHGYEFPKDGFGYAGAALTPQPGERATLKLRRLNLAERLYRLTGEGLYRDSVLLGEPTPLAEPLGSGKVAGQDSTLAIPYRDRVYWFWGDTSRMSYPLGHFRTAGATSDLPGKGGLDPSVGVNYRYFTQPDGFSRPMASLGFESGMVWIDGLVTLPDGHGGERLVGHYNHMESLAKRLGHGLIVFDDARAEFARLKELPAAETWRFPHYHPVKHLETAGEFLYCGEVFLNARVPANSEAIADASRYEAFTCLTEDSTPEQPKVDRDAQGQVRWGWHARGKPLDQDTEQKLVASGALAPAETRFSPVDVESGKPVKMHRGSIRWNAFRQRWVLIAAQIGGTSMLGEIWYAEAPASTGPWRRARKILTHDRYSFYNPVQHAFFDQEGGRRIYFEGTYVNTFSGNPDTTPRYDYNQILYRLDLADPRLRAAQE